jgi:putative transcriptional regulator
MGTVNNRIRELRLGQGWTQAELAAAVRVSRQSVNSIECGRYVPSLELALAFAKLFARPVESIFELEGKR